MLSLQCGKCLEKATTEGEEKGGTLQGSRRHIDWSSSAVLEEKGMCLRDIYAVSRICSIWKMRGMRESDTIPDAGLCGWCLQFYRKGTLEEEQTWEGR